MAVKIFIKRKVQTDNSAQLSILLKKLRVLTLEQPGYLSGETFNRIDKPNECMVISTWRSVEDWNAWVNSPKRNEIQTVIDQLIGEDTEYAIYSA